MNTNTLFESLHGMLDESQLIPILSVDEKTLKNYNITSQDIRLVMDYLKITGDHLYYNPLGSIFPFCYWDGFFYFPFTSLHSSILLHSSIILNEGGSSFSDVSRFRIQYQHMYKLLAQKDWDHIMMFSDKKVSFHVFSYLREKANMPSVKQKELFLDIYARNEYGFDRLDPDMVRDVLNAETPNEYTIPLVYQPDQEGYYTIYRGETAKSSSLQKAYSWTLEYKVAEFFFTRFQSTGTIYIRRVHESKIKAFIPNRGESEVLVFPEDIREVG